VSQTVLASDGASLDLAQLAGVVTRTAAGKIETITVTLNGKDYVQTFSYDDNDLLTSYTGWIYTP
jgi:predicted MarR family transcription regulator